MNIRQSTIAILADWRAPDPTQDSLRHTVLAFIHS